MIIVCNVGTRLEQISCKKKNTNLIEKKLLKVQNKIVEAKLLFKCNIMLTNFSRKKFCSKVCYTLCNDCSVFEKWRSLAMVEVNFIFRQSLFSTVTKLC